MNRILDTPLPAALIGALLLSASLLLTAGCAHKAVRTEALQADDILDINFAARDLSSLAEQMIDDMLAFTPIVQVTAQRRPVIFVYRIRNNTGEKIDTDAIIDTIQAKITDDNKFSFVDMAAIKPVQEQLDRQMESGRMDPKTAVRLGQQIGAEYMLYGTIEPPAKPGLAATGTDKQATKVRDHHVFALRLIHLPSGIVEWQREQKIRNSRAR